LAEAAFSSLALFEKHDNTNTQVVVSSMRNHHVHDAASQRVMGFEFPSEWVTQAIKLKLCEYLPH